MASEFNKTLVQLKDVLADEKFVDELVNLETADEVKAKLNERNVDLTTEQIEVFKEKLVNRQEGEISEDDLEDVAGGIDSSISTEMRKRIYDIISHEDNRWRARRTW